MSQLLKRISIRFSTSHYFVLGLVITLLFLVISDVRILYDGGNLYGGVDVDPQTMEETYMYLPYVSLFSFNSLLRIDYSGPSDEEKIAPYPYFSIAILGSVGKLAGGNINIAILLLHGLIILLYIVVYAFYKLFIKDDIVRSLLSFITIWAPFFSVDSFVPIFKILLFVSPFLILLLWKKNNKAGILFIIIILATLLYGLLYEKITGMPYYVDIQRTRFITPVIPLGIFYCTLYFLVCSYKTLNAERKKFLSNIGLLLFFFVLNFYTYYLNYLILGPMLLLFFVRYRKKIFQGKRIYSILSGACIFAVPFVYSLYLSFTNQAYQDMKLRAGVFDRPPAHSWNYPFDNKITLLLMVALVVTLFSLYFIRYRLKWLKSNFITFFCLSGFLSALLIFSGNYIINDFIPQALLVYRYFMPMLLLAFIPLINPLLGYIKIEKIKIGLMQFVFLGFAVYVLTGGLSKYNVYSNFTKPTNAEIYDTLGYIKKHIPQNAIFVSNYNIYNMMVPGILGIKTLDSAPLNTVATFHTLVTQSFLKGKILGFTENDMRDYIIGTGKFINMAHFAVVPQKLPQLALDEDLRYLSDQTQVLYQAYIDKNWGRLKDEFTHFDYKISLLNFTGIYLLYINGIPPSNIMNDLVLVNEENNRKVYRFQ